MLRCVQQAEIRGQDEVVLEFARRSPGDLEEAREVEPAIAAATLLMAVRSIVRPAPVTRRILSPLAVPRFRQTDNG